MRAGLCTIAVGVVLLTGSGAAASTPTGVARLVVFTQYKDNGLGSDDTATLYVARLGSRGARRLTEQCVDCSDDARWSPDGKLIAYDGTGDDSDQGIYVMRADGMGKRRLCGGPGEPADLCSLGGYPTWSPDGRTVAFAVGRSVTGGGGIGIERLDQTGFHTVPHTHAYAITGLDWSPDGKRFAFEADFGAVDVVAADGTGARRIADKVLGPRWSPDGTRLVFSSSDYNSPGVFVATRTGQVTEVLKVHTSSVDWWDNDHLFYAQWDGLHVYDLNKRHDERIAPLPDVCRGREIDCGSFEVQPSPDQVRLVGAGGSR
jgi:Tol biopolymer transport system component